MANVELVRSVNYGLESWKVYVRGALLAEFMSREYAEATVRRLINSIERGIV